MAWIWGYNQMKIELILVAILVLISAETIGGMKNEKAKEVVNHDNVKKTVEKPNKQQGHDNADVKNNVENGREKKNAHVKSANHQNIKGKKKTHSEKVEGSHNANPKGLTKTAHKKEAKNHSPDKKTDNKNVHSHQTKGKETRTNKRVEGNHNAMNVPHKVSPKKIHPNDKANQHIASTNSPKKHIQTNQKAKVVKDQQKAHQKSIESILNVISQIKSQQSAFNSSEVIGKAKQGTNTSMPALFLSNKTKAEGNHTVIEEEESSTDSEEDSEQQSLDSDTKQQTVADSNSETNVQQRTQIVKQDNPVQTINKTLVKQPSKEDSSTLIVKESNTSKALKSEENQTAVQETSIKQENNQKNKTEIQKVSIKFDKIEEGHPKVEANPIKQEHDKTTIVKTDLSKPQAKQSLPKQPKNQILVTQKKKSEAFGQQEKPNFHTNVEKKTQTLTIDVSAFKESQRAQTNDQPSQPPKYQAVEDKKETTQPKLVQAKAPQERHLKVQKETQDDIDRLLRQVNAQKAKQKSKIADQILDLQVKLHQQPAKAQESKDTTLYIIFFLFAIVIAVPIIKCLTKTNQHPEPGMRIVQFQEEDSTRLSGPQSGDNLEEMI